MIHELLLTGQENAQSAKALCNQLHIDSRALRKAIEHERRQGHPICAVTTAGASGYFLAADQKEMRAYCNKIWHAVNSLAKTCRACQRIIPALPVSEGAELSEAKEDFTIFDLMEAYDNERISEDN